MDPCITRCQVSEERKNVFFLDTGVELIRIIVNSELYKHIRLLDI